MSHFNPPVALSSTWRERHPRLATALVAFGDVLGTGLLAMVVYVWAVYLR